MQTFKEQVLSPDANVERNQSNTDMRLEPNGEGNRAKAWPLLDESRAISTKLGMRTLMERVMSRREILGAQLLKVRVVRFRDSMEQ